MHRDVVLDDHSQFGDAAEYAVAQAVSSDVAKELLDKPGIARHLKLLAPMRLQPVRNPKALNCRVGHPDPRCQRAHAPLRRGVRFGLRGQTHDFEGISRV